MIAKPLPDNCQAIAERLPNVAERLPSDSQTIAELLLNDH
jgi:hypothetical protein